MNKLRSQIRKGDFITISGLGQVPVIETKTVGDITTLTVSLPSGRQCDLSGKTTGWIWV